MKTVCLGNTGLITMVIPTVSIATVGTAIIRKGGSEITPPTPDEPTWLYDDGTDILWGNGDRVLTD